MTHTHMAWATLNFLKPSYPGKLVKRLIPNVKVRRLKHASANLVDTVDPLHPTGAFPLAQQGDYQAKV